MTDRTTFGAAGSELTVLEALLTKPLGGAVFYLLNFCVYYTHTQTHTNIQ